MFREQRTLYEQRIDAFIFRLEELFYIEKIPLEASFCIFDPMAPFAKRLHGEYRPIKEGMVWGENWQRAWFRLRGRTPENWRGKKVVAKVNLGGEGCLFSADGVPALGISFHSLWMDNFVRERIDITECAEGGEPVELWIAASASQLFGLQLQRDPNIDSPKRYGDYKAQVREMSLAVFRQDVWQLYIDVFVLNNLMKSMPEKSVRRARLLNTLNRAVDVFQKDADSVHKVRDILRPELQKKNSPTTLATLAVGHAHLDTAWLWPTSEAIEKCARTFSSQLDLMKKYPDYVFGASQAQHYAFMKEYYPSLFQKIKEKVADGQWELQGGMWVEADCNLIDGESIVRQILYGKKFFRDEFGVDVRNLWIPDVFGYSAAMPQILKKCGLEALVTQKLSWNQFNTFPHNTFIWQGIDGSRVVAHFPPENTYNSLLSPSGLRHASDNFCEKDRLDEFLTLFGIGDGGGGPTEEILETGLRQKDLEGAPRVTFGKAQDFLDRLQKHMDDLPVWDGELYLEMHRGTLTTQAFNKKMNRMMEYRLRQLEMLYSILPFSKYPAAAIERMWKKLLLNQFHDILPGSGIHKVYEDSRKDYLELQNKAADLLEKAGKLLLKKDERRLCFVNTSSYTYTRPLLLPEGWAACDILDKKGGLLPSQQEEESVFLLLPIPPFSSVTVQKGKSKRAAANPGGGLVLENDLVRYEMNPDGTIRRAFDKEFEREILLYGGVGNALHLYEDRPANWDAWDIDIFYENQRLQQAQLRSMEWRANGPVRQSLRLIFNVGDSEIAQTVSLAVDSKRLDFETTVQWRERHKMLRVGFDVNIHTRTAAFDIQYGWLHRATHRNTSWDMAKFESVAHKFVDLSEVDYGVALLNDCKYGHKVYGTRMEIALLRSPTNPDPEADRGRHDFTYSMLPHGGDLTHSEVFAQAAQLNSPPALFDGYDGDRFRMPFALSNEDIVLETAKKAEREEAMVLRLFEHRGRWAETELVFENKVQVYETDMMEENARPLVLRGNVLPLRLRPFEIKTLKCLRI